MNSYYILRRRRSSATKLGSFSPKRVVPNYLSLVQLRTIHQR